MINASVAIAVLVPVLVGLALMQTNLYLSIA